MVLSVSLGLEEMILPSLELELVSQLQLGIVQAVTWHAFQSCEQKSSKSVLEQPHGKGDDDCLNVQHVFSDIHAKNIEAGGDGNEKSYVPMQGYMSYGETVDTVEGANRLYYSSYKNPATREKDSDNDQKSWEPRTEQYRSNDKAVVKSSKQVGADVLHDRDRYQRSLEPGQCLLSDETVDNVARHVVQGTNRFHFDDNAKAAGYMNMQVDHRNLKDNVDVHRGKVDIEQRDNMNCFSAGDMKQMQDLGYDFKNGNVKNRTRDLNVGASATNQMAGDFDGNIKKQNEQFKEDLDAENQNVPFDNSVEDWSDEFLDVPAEVHYPVPKPLEIEPNPWRDFDDNESSASDDSDADAKGETAGKASEERKAERPPMVPGDPRKIFVNNIEYRVGVVVDYM